VENGIRMTGMPGFKGKLTEPQIWQVSVLVKNADKISAVVKAALLSNEPPATPVIPAKPTVVPPTR
jgi:mono/diheme cytochrome c family protein